jgi:thiol-disulfide isomerase/thioredoxin
MPRPRRALSPGVSAGFAALVAAIAVAVAGGAGFRLASGRMRRPRSLVQRAARRPHGPDQSGHAFVAATAAQPTSEPSRLTSGPSRLTSEQLGHALGERATLLQFSTAFCAPCRATRRILADVAGMTQGVTHVEIDAESRLDLVRQLNVLRTPTVLILSADGSIVRRASGQPRKPDVIAAIALAAGLS